MSKKYCKYCGVQLLDDGPFCYNCGKKNSAVKSDEHITKGAEKKRGFSCGSCLLGAIIMLVIIVVLFFVFRLGVSSRLEFIPLFN